MDAGKYLVIATEWQGKEEYKITFIDWYSFDTYSEARGYIDDEWSMWGQNELSCRDGDTVQLELCDGVILTYEIHCIDNAEIFRKVKGNFAELKGEFKSELFPEAEKELEEFEYRMELHEDCRESALELLCARRGRSRVLNFLECPLPKEYIEKYL